MNRFTATYSPEDNKLRLSSASRLEPALYLKVKEAGFRWAPKQEVFVAPMWTPEREDLLLELAGEVGDEDTSLADRAEQRAERFEEYRESRLGDAESARKAVAAIADNIPLGQPILVGHHSEKHARRDAQRIEDGMRRAVRMWDTAQYWKSRAAGALRHARYKERPEVRHRRIKTLGADKRRMERQRSALNGWRMFWAAEDLTREKAVERLRYGYGDDALHKSLKADEVTLEQVVEQKAKAYGRAIEQVDRWIAHYDNRITYETAMLDEQIGTGELGQGMAGRFDVAIGGQVFDGREWCIILKVNKDAAGNVSSVTTTAPKVVHWTNRWNVGIEKIIDYRAPRDQVLAMATQVGDTFEAMRQAAKAGVEVVVVRNLFPTPAHVADRVVSLLGIEPGDRVLEPSAGTGALIDAITRAGAQPVTIDAVEVNGALAEQLIRRPPYPHLFVRCGDFLEMNVGHLGDIGRFDKVLMNPPFENGADIRHVEHALSMLKGGGRLVAIMAYGPRQVDWIEVRDDVMHWESLPPGTFEGTQVRAMIAVFQTVKHT